MNGQEQIGLILLGVLIFHNAYEYFFWNRIEKKKYDRTSKDVNWNRFK